MFRYAPAMWQVSHKSGLTAKDRAEVRDLVR